jgi:hypothetical protein
MRPETKARLQEALGKQEKNDNIRLVKLDPIEDNIIEDLDPNTGEETLRLGFTVAGRQIECRFPVLGKWDKYTGEMAELFILLSQKLAHLQIPDDYKEILEKANDKLGMWALLSAAVLKRTKLRDKVVRIFFKYLRPTSNGTKVNRRWLMNNAPFDAVYRMFVAILSIDAWVKKKSTSILETVFKLVLQSSSPKSESEPVGSRNEYKAHQFSSSVSY